MLPGQHLEHRYSVQHVRGNVVRAPTKLPSATFLPSCGADHLVRPGGLGRGRHLLRRVVRKLWWKWLLETPRRERVVLQITRQERGRLCNLPGHGLHGAGQLPGMRTLHRNMR